MPHITKESVHVKASVANPVQDKDKTDTTKGGPFNNGVDDEIDHSTLKPKRTKE